MATLAKSAVSLYGGVSNMSAAEFYVNRPSLVVRRLKLVLTGQGGQTNTITAHALGFELMVTCSTLFDDANDKGYPAAIDPVTQTINLFDGAAAPAPVDVTSSAAYITVIGILRLDAGLT
jgi:hypothetical protein